MKKIVLASRDFIKKAELQRIVPNGVEVVNLNDFPQASFIHDKHQYGDTFLQNAHSKAFLVSKVLELPVIAESSGLQIDVLGGNPGVNLHSYIAKTFPCSGINVDNPAELYPFLLKIMKESKIDNMRARLVSAVVYVNNPTELRVEEFLDGTMCNSTVKKRTSYKNYFVPSGFNSSLANLSPAINETLSPRSRALKKLLETLASWKELP